MSELSERSRPRLAGTGRIETFSDGVVAIIVTLLIFEVAVPVVDRPTNQKLLEALGEEVPKFLSFAVSFFTVAIFWVNHHHFFHRITHSDWKLMWLNNLLLFWLTVVPFSTAFIGDYPREPVAVAVYAFTLCMAALAFTLMGHYVFFGGRLVEDSVSEAERRKEWHRSWWGTGAYAAAVALAFVWVYAALAIIAVLPFVYVVPALLGVEDEPL